MIMTFFTKKITIALIATSMLLCGISNCSTNDSHFSAENTILHKTSADINNNSAIMYQKLKNMKHYFLLDDLLNSNNCKVEDEMFQTIEHNDHFFIQVFDMPYDKSNIDLYLVLRNNYQDACFAYRQKHIIGSGSLLYSPFLMTKITNNSCTFCNIYIKKGMSSQIDIYQVFKKTFRKNEAKLMCSIDLSDYDNKLQIQNKNNDMNLIICKNSSIAATNNHASYRLFFGNTGKMDLYNKDDVIQTLQEHVQKILLSEGIPDFNIDPIDKITDYMIMV